MELFVHALHLSFLVVALDEEVILVDEEDPVGVDELDATHELHLVLDVLNVCTIHGQTVCGQRLFFEIFVLRVVDDLAAAIAYLVSLEHALDGLVDVLVLAGVEEKLVTLFLVLPFILAMMTNNEVVAVNRVVNAEVVHVESVYDSEFNVIVTHLEVGYEDVCFCFHNLGLMADAHLVRVVL